MEPYAHNIVTFRVLLRGYERAVERFGHASITRDAVQVFAPLFEALNWAVALDDQARAHWAPEGVPLDWAWRTRINGGELVNAVRGARNRVHHQWADALTLSEGLASPLEVPLVAHEWRWRRLDELPQTAPPRGEPRANAEVDYQRLLEGMPARNTLAGLLAPFRQLANILEPPGPGRPE
jgi:hypothetical protein